MKTGLHANSRWSTASFGGPTDTSPMDLLALSDHLSLCQRATGRWLSLHYVVERVHGFLAARLVTTAAVLMLAVGLGSLLQ